jgi:hypothetical protein
LVGGRSRTSAAAAASALAEVLEIHRKSVTLKFLSGRPWRPWSALVRDDCSRRRENHARRWAKVV